MTALNVTYAASFWRQRRFWSTIVIAIWFAWLALMLIACSDATPFLPLIMLVNAPLWLVLLALTGLVSGRRLIIAAAVVTAIGLGFTLSDWDFRLRCKLSEPALRQFISENQAQLGIANGNQPRGESI
jgi:hypothetical protein